MVKRSPVSDNENRTPATVSGAELRAELRKMLGARDVGVVVPEGWERAAMAGREGAIMELLCWLSGKANGGGTV